MLMRSLLKNLKTAPLQAALLLLLSGSFLMAPAQYAVWSPDSTALSAPNYRMDRYHRLLRYHDPLLYIAFPLVKPIADRPLPLQNGEGKNGYWLEGNFAYRFALYQGKYYSYPLLQRLRPTIDVGLMPRLTRDASSPLLPFNNQFGVGTDLLLSSLSGLHKERPTLVWTTFQLHHYSNGQADSFFVEGPVERNNYRSGDFSTNYWRGALHVSHVGQKNIVTGSVGYQEDVDLGGPLVRSPELYHRYGEQRVLASLQFTRKPRLVTATYANRATAEEDVVKEEVRRQWMFRTEASYIVSGLSKYSRSNKQRLGWHNYLTYMPSLTNEVGLLLHTYIGRDYLNIRFDDAVFIGEAGLFFTLNGR
jgi:hypothetical protein